MESLKLQPKPRREEMGISELMKEAEDDFNEAMGYKSIRNRKKYDR